MSASSAPSGRATRSYGSGARILSIGIASTGLLTFAYFSIDTRRLVDFASGLVFGLDGKIELVANRVYLLTPANMEVSAEERERLREGGFYNQF